ncbi:hypothetical protein LMG33818_000901 [Halomonadaceae bacterium LMG 33818]|uniref:hypothetical protein n=1 Tax=Cernens ardua TaxID=3402176 RepID=UPI003EDCB280
MILRYLKLWPYALIALLAYACWHYRGSAASWHNKANQQKTRADKAEDANTTLMASNVQLDQRNKTLLESLNVRSTELEVTQKRAEAARSAYEQALSTNRDWASERVPRSVADSLRRATSGVQDDSSTEGTASK